MVSLTNNNNTLHNFDHENTPIEPDHDTANQYYHHQSTMKTIIFAPLMALDLESGDLIKPLRVVIKPGVTWSNYVAFVY